jgi:hypothetical protein
MAAGVPPAPVSVLEVIDRILDRDTVMDAVAGVSLIGIELLTIRARMVVASIGSYLKYAERIHEMDLVAKPIQAE